MKLILPPYAEVDGVARGPHKRQAEFHALEQRIKMYRGGVGAGKSLAGSREMMATVLEDLQHSQQLGGADLGGALYLVGAPSYDMIDVGPWFHIVQWLDAFERVNSFKLEKRRWESHPRRIELITGQVLKFLSVDNPSKWAAATACSAWLDESELAKEPMAAFRTLQSRLRDNRVHSHKMIVTSSPRGARGCAQWFADKIAADDPDFGLVVGSTLDNPGNPSSYVADMLKSMSERERKQQIEAALLSTDNAIYQEEFHESQSIDHKWKYQRGGSQQYNLAIDWGGHYHALLISYDPNTDTDTVIDEWTATGVQDEEFCQKVVEGCRDRWALRPGDITEVIADYHPRAANYVAYSVWRGKVKNRRVRDNEDRWSRINTTRWRLKEAATGKRRLLFHPNLRSTKSKRGVLRSIANYSLSERMVEGQRVTLDRPVQDSPFSHSMDALGLYNWIRYSHLRFYDRRAVGVAA